jgi:hypothetical protein
VRRTRRFPRLLTQARAALVASYREQDPSGLADDPSAFIALSLLLGDWERVKKKLPLSPEARTWFDPEGTAEELRQALER